MESIRERGLRRPSMAVLIPAAVVVLLLLHSAHLAWRYRDMPQLGLRHDDSLYWVSAKSLAEGKGYRVLSLPNQPYQTKYPPLYPWLLSWVYRIQPSFPENLPLATLFAWLALPVFLLLAKRIFSDLGFSSRDAWLLTALLAVNADVEANSHLLMSELVFSILLMGALCLVESDSKTDSGAWRGAVAGLLGGAAYLTKTAALPLLATAPIWLWRRQRPRGAALFFLAMAPFVLGWAIWVKTHLIPRSDLVSLYYTNYLGFHLANFSLADLPLLVWRNLAGILLGIGGLLLFSVPEGWAGRALWLVLALGALAGVVRLARLKGTSQFCWFAAGCILLLLGWHVGAHDRYERLLLPLLPLLLAGLLVAFCSALGWLKAMFESPGMARLALACFLSAGLAAFVSVVAVTTFAARWQLPRHFLEDPRRESAEKQRYYDWISGHVPVEAAVLSPVDVLTYLHTGRKGFLFVIPPRLVYERDRRALSRWFQSIGEFARTHRARYLVSWTKQTDPRSPLGEAAFSVERAIREDRQFRLVYESREISVYERAESP